MEPMASILRRLCFVDIETTGLDPRKEEIIEIGAVFVDRGQITSRRRWLVRPTRPIPALITALTGLTDAEVAGSPRLHELDAELAEALGGWTLVAHNAGFERSFLGQRIVLNPMIDSCEVAQLLFPDLASHSLDALIRWLAVGRAARHRALDDAEDTFLVLAALCDLALAEGSASQLESLRFHLAGATNSADRAALCALFDALVGAPRQAPRPPALPIPVDAAALRLARQLASWLRAPTFVAAELDRGDLMALAIEAGHHAAEALRGPVAVAVSAGSFRQAQALPALARHPVCRTGLTTALATRGEDERACFARAYLAAWLSRTRTGERNTVSSFVRSRFPEVQPLLDAAVCHCEANDCFARRGLGDEPCVLVTHEHALDWLEQGVNVPTLFLEAERLPEAERRRCEVGLWLDALRDVPGLEPAAAELRCALEACPAGVVVLRARTGPKWLAVREAVSNLAHALRASPLGPARANLLGRLVQVMEPPPCGFEVKVSPQGLVRVPSRPGSALIRRLGAGHCLVSRVPGGLGWTRSGAVSTALRGGARRLEWVAEPTSLETLAALVASVAPVVLVTPSPLGPVAEACQRQGLSVSLEAGRGSAVQLAQWRRDEPPPVGATCVFYGVREWRRAALGSGAHTVLLVSPTGLSEDPLNRALRGLNPRQLTWPGALPASARAS